MVPPPGADEPRADLASVADDPATGTDPEATELGPDASATDHRLLARARALATIDLAHRPDAFEELDSAIVSELRAIEDL